jgi:hypothetical protein
VDRYLRDGALVVKPPHPNQHAYQAGKSVAKTLHQLVVRMEQALDQRELAVGASLNIERAYNYTSFDCVGTTLCSHGVNSTTVWWIWATLECHLATATLSDVSVRVAVARECPQGGVPSPLLWCLPVDGWLDSEAQCGWDILSRLCWWHLSVGSREINRTRCQSSCRGHFTL